MVSNIAIYCLYTNGFKHRYLTLIILVNIIHLFAQLNGFKHCYLILIQFNINHLFAHSLTVSKIVNDLIVLFHSEIRPKQVLPHQVRVDLRVMVMKGYSTFPKAPEMVKYYLYPRHSLQRFSQHILQHHPIGLRLSIKVYKIFNFPRDKLKKKKKKKLLMKFKFC